MKSIIGKTLKTGLPLGLGVFLIYWMFKDITEEEKQQIINSFKEANYFWIWICVLGGLISHVSRAYRWKFALEPLGYKPKFLNSFFTVLIGYLVNLLIPRMGEISRCAYLAKHEGFEFNKVFGTVIAERVVDFILLVAMIFGVFILQFDTIGGFLMKSSFFQKLANPTSLIILALIGGAFVFIGYKVLTTSTNGFIIKIKKFIAGIIDGVIAIMKMEKKWWFLFHTVIIWVLYILMYYVAFFSMEGVSEVPIGAVISSFVAGGIAIATTNGGLGAYPIAIQSILILYGINETIGLAFGWIVWVAQTAMIIVAGMLSIILISIINKPSVEPQQNL